MLSLTQTGVQSGRVPPLLPGHRDVREQRAAAGHDDTFSAFLSNLCSVTTGRVSDSELSSCNLGSVMGSRWSLEKVRRSG